MKYLTSLFFVVKSFVVGCPFDRADCDSCNDLKFGIKKIGYLPEEVVESSGLAAYEDLFITHPDSGNPPMLWGVKYPFDKERQVNGTIDLQGRIVNTDWEDLAQDDEDNLYIGDFGNNNNSRKNLSIVKYNLLSQSISKISFYYPDQAEFPPSKNKGKNFDCEAMIWLQGNLYLFSKNRGNRNVKIYRLPDQPGNYEAEIVGTLNLPLQITAADVSPDGQFVALLAYGKVLLYRVEFDDDEKLVMVPFNCKQFNRSGQAEAIIFLDNEHLLITNEKGKVFYMYVKKDRKSKKKFNPELEKLFPPPEPLELGEFQ